jgi:plastocyanin
MRSIILNLKERASTPRVLAWVVGTAMVATSASNTLSGTIEGRLVVPAIAPSTQQAASSPYPGMEMPPVGRDDARSAAPADAVIWIENLSRAVGAPSVSGTAPELRQVRYSFRPRVLGISVGTTVEFPNEDAVFHNVFSYSKTKRFDLGYYGKGRSKRVTFDSPGIVKVFCDIHSHMSAFIVVADSKFVVTPGPDGRFTFDNVPDGTWRIRTWHPELGEVTHEVTVAGSTTRVDIRY